MPITPLNSNIFKGTGDGEGTLTVSELSFRENACLISKEEVLNQYSIIWIKRGEATYKIDFDDFTGENESIFFLSPGQVFCIESEQIQQAYKISFDHDFYCTQSLDREIGCNGVLFNNFYSTAVVTVDQETCSRLELLYADLKRTILEGKTAVREKLTSYLKIFLIETTDVVKQQSNRAEIWNSGEDMVRTFNNLVEKHFRKHHSVAEYAAMLHIAPKTLNKRLAKYNKRPLQVIHERILLEAKRLMFHSGYSIKEIAFALGFDDPAYFSRFFKKKAGTYPDHFRKMLAQRRQRLERIDV